VQLEVQLVRPHRELAPNPVEERVDAAVPLRRQRRETVERCDPFDHLAGRAAAPVAVADREQALVVSVLTAEAPPRLDRGARSGPRVVALDRVVEHVGEHAAAVEPLPPEQVVRESVGL
jgi:hypothetical protein